MGCCSSKKREKEPPLVPSTSTPKIKPLNIALVGNTGVGKSSLLLRFLSNEWTDDELELREKTTVGTDFVSKKIELDGKERSLQIWDTGGQERYATMTQSYYRQSDCIVCVYDVSDSQSFEDVPRWWKELDRYSKEIVPRVLVGNKIDLERMIETSQGEELAKELGALLFIETSAKESINAVQVFTEWISKRGEEQ